jgi:hypothetical protein
MRQKVRELREAIRTTRQAEQLKLLFYNDSFARIRRLSSDEAHAPIPASNRFRAGGDIWHPVLGSHLGRQMVSGHWVAKELRSIRAAQKLNRITINPQIMNGQPCICGMRLRDSLSRLPLCTQTGATGRAWTGGLAAKAHPGRNRGRDQKRSLRRRNRPFHPSARERTPAGTSPASTCPLAGEGGSSIHRRLREPGGGLRFWCSVANGGALS